MKSFLTLAIAFVLLIANSKGEGGSDATPDKTLGSSLKKLDRALALLVQKINNLQKDNDVVHGFMNVLDDGCSAYKLSLPAAKENAIADIDKLVKQASTLQDLFKFFTPALDTVIANAKDTKSYLSQSTESC